MWRWRALAAAAWAPATASPSPTAWGSLTATTGASSTAGLVNHGDVPYTIQPGDRIPAQLMVLPILRPTLTVVEELDETERGAGGFGSTGR